MYLFIWILLRLLNWLLANSHNYHLWDPHMNNGIIILNCRKWKLRFYKDHIKFQKGLYHILGIKRIRRGGTLLFHYLSLIEAEWRICVSRLTIIDSDNGLSPGWRQTIIWNNVEILLIGPLETNFGEILIKINISSFKKMSSGKRR